MTFWANNDGIEKNITRNLQKTNREGRAGSQSTENKTYCGIVTSDLTSIF